MKAGGGKQKGGQFERDVCKRLSYWISKGTREDIFWRSAMSGGRATVHGMKVRQAGDICAVAPEGHAFCNKFFVECKHVKKLGLDQFIVKDTGPLATFWKKAHEQASKRGLHTMIIARQNGWPIMVFYDCDDMWNEQAAFRGIYMIAFDDLLSSAPPKFKAIK